MKKWISTFLIGLAFSFYLNAQVFTDFQDVTGVTVSSVAPDVPYATEPAVGDDPDDAANKVIVVEKNTDSTFAQSIVVTFDSAKLVGEGDVLSITVKAPAEGVRAYFWAYDHEGTEIMNTWSENTTSAANTYLRLTKAGQLSGKYVKKLQISLGGWDNSNVPTGFKGTYYIDTIQVLIPPHVDVVEPRVTGNIQYITDAIDFDGLATEDTWADAEIYDIVNTDSTANPNATYQGYFMGAWDDDYLYLYVEMDDATIFDYKDDPTNSWQKDNVQLYFDVRNQLLDGTKDDYTQHQVTVPFTEGEEKLSYIYAGAGVDGTPYYARDTNDVYLKSFNIKGATSWTMEMRIPFAAMYFNNDDVATMKQCIDAVDVTNGKVIGFEIQGNDYNIATKVRDHISFWSTYTTDVPGAYQNSGIWGGLVLQHLTPVKETNAINARIYPNPAQANLTVELEGMHSIELLDLTGRVILVKQVQGNATTFDVSNLNSGIYMIRVHADNGIAVQKIQVN